VVSARGAYLRAAEYLRQAFFFHRDDLDGPELRAAYPASVQAFQAALPLLGHPASVLSGGLSGYLFRPAGPVRPRPVILHIGGYDGTAEELCAAAGYAQQRGCAFAAIDGPARARCCMTSASREARQRPGSGRPVRLAAHAPQDQDAAGTADRHARRFERPDYVADMLNYTNAAIIGHVTCPSYVTDNESDVVSTGQGRELFDHLTCSSSSACSPGPREPTATARAWHRSCSGRQPSTGSTT
jgi:hypothetical protein